MNPQRPLLIAIGAIGLLLSSCGDDGQTSSTGTATEGTDTSSTGGSTSGTLGTTDGTSAGPETDPSGSESNSNSGSTSVGPTSTTSTATTDPSTSGPTTDPSTTSTDPSTTDPSTTSTSGTTGMVSGCDGLGDVGLLLHTTLDDAASVLTPAVGMGVGEINTNPADDFAVALSGNGVNIDEGSEYVRYPQRVNGGDNVDLMQGTIDFCYQPAYDHTDGQNHALFEIKAAMQNGGFLKARKAAGNNNNTFQVLYLEPGPNGTFGELSVPPNAYALNAGEWYRVTISWDFGVGPNEQNVHVYIDGAEIIDNSPPTGPASMAGPDPNDYVSIGFFAGQPWPAAGVIDDFKLYDSALVP